MFRTAIAILMMGTCVAVAKPKRKEAPVPPLTAATEPCGSISESFAEITHAGAKASFMTNDELKRATIIYNTIPPPSNSKWDFALFVDNADESGVVMFGSNGEVCKSMSFDAPGMWERVRQAIIGGQWT